MSKGKKDEIVKVDFAFRRELARKVEGNLASFCYQCGACVGDCPATTYSEGFNPREIMLQVLYGLGDELLGEDSLLWQCTNCYNCHERCPQEVKPVEVIISLKNMLADRGVYPDAVAKVIKTFEKTGRTVAPNPAIDRQRGKFGLPPMPEAPMEELRAIIEPGGAAQPVQKSEPKAAKEPADSKRMAFFPGCLIPTRYPGMEFAIRKGLEGLGVELVDLEGTSCCPDPIYFKSKDKVSWLSVAARNLTIAEDLGVDIVTNCSGCTATLSETYHLLEDEELRDKINRRLAKVGREYRGTSRIRHLATVLREDVGYEAVRKSVVRPLDGLKVAIHYGCHLLKPSKIMNVDDPNNPEILERLVEAIGGNPVRHKNWYLCCGKAAQDQEIPDTMMHDLLGTVHEEQAEILGLICPTCFGQFDHGQARIAKLFDEDFNTPAVYYMQLLAFAQGVPYDKLGFERQRFKPKCLKRYEEPDKEASSV
jgi:heterodisulfide reductase subunit B